MYKNPSSSLSLKIGLTCNLYRLARPLYLLHWCQYIILHWLTCKWSSCKADTFWHKRISYRRETARYSVAQFWLCKCRSTHAFIQFLLKFLQCNNVIYSGRFAFIFARFYCAFAKLTEFIPPSTVRRNLWHHVMIGLITAEFSWLSALDTQSVHCTRLLIDGRCMRLIV